MYLVIMYIKKEEKKNHHFAVKDSFFFVIVINQIRKRITMLVDPFFKLNPPEAVPDNVKKNRGMGKYFTIVQRKHVSCFDDF